MTSLLSDPITSLNHKKDRYDKIVAIKYQYTLLQFSLYSSGRQGPPKGAFLSRSHFYSTDTVKPVAG